jgi:DNA polymerase-3 subunit alpha
MGKKKVAEMEKEKDIFINGLVENGRVIIEGALRRGVSIEIANKVFEEMAAFAGYGFNKSHAAGYAVLTYQTAYLKKYYPLQFMATVLNNRIYNLKEITTYINYLKESSVTVLPPCVNSSFENFSVDGESIRFGLVAVKNVGTNAAQSIISERGKGGKFKDLYDFLSRIDLSLFNKRTVQSLIFAGAFDCFGISRSSLIACFEKLMAMAASAKETAASGQFSMFDMIEEETKFDYPKLPEYPNLVKLKYEKEVLGVYASSHPLADYEEVLKEFKYNTAKLSIDEDDDDEFLAEERLKELNNENVALAGIITHVKKIIVKSNNREMAYITLEDGFGSVEVMVYNREYLKLKEKLRTDNIVKITGQVSTRDGSVKIVAKTIEELSVAAAPKANEILYLKVDYSLENASLEKELISMLEAYAGNVPVRVYSIVDNKVYEYGFLIDPGNALVWELSALLGEGNVKLVER